MQVRTRLKVFAIPFWIRIASLIRVGRKVDKLDDDKKYPYQWRNDFIIRKVKRFSNYLNMELKVTGWENLPKAPSIIVANHSTFFDPVLILLAMRNPSTEKDALNPQPVFLGKKSLTKNRIVRGAGRINKAFFIDRNNPREAVEIINKLIEHAKAERRHAVIFPEGTRSRTGEVLEFKGGAFRAAKQHFLPVVPVTIINGPSIFDLRRNQRLVVEVVFHKPLKPMQMMSMDTISIAAIVQKQVTNAWRQPVSVPQGKDDFQGRKVDD